MGLKRKTVLGLLGLFGGVVIGLGVPWAVLVHGKGAGLSSGVLVALSLAGIAGGVVLSAVSVIYSIVTPSDGSEYAEYDEYDEYDEDDEEEV